MTETGVSRLVNDEIPFSGLVLGTYLFVDENRELDEEQG